MFDLHPLVALPLAVICAAGAWVCGVAVGVFWRVEPWQPRRTVLWCRTVGAAFAVFAAGMWACAALYAVAGLAPPLVALYGWVVR